MNQKQIQLQSVVEQCGELYKSLRSMYGPTHGLTTAVASVYANIHPNKVNGLNALKRSINFDARGDEPFTGLTFEQKMAEIRKSNAKELPYSDLRNEDETNGEDVTAVFVEPSEPKKRGRNRGAEWNPPTKKKLAAEGENEPETEPENNTAE